MPDLDEQLRSKLEHVDERLSVARTTSHDLFDLLDADNSGEISRDEFAHMYKAVRAQVHAEHIKEADLEKSKNKAKRRVKLLGVVSGLLVFLVAILLAGNAGLVFLLLEATKETEASRDGRLTVAGSNSTVRVNSAETHPDTQGRLLDEHGDVIQTAPALERVPMKIAPLLPVETLNQVTTIVVKRDPSELTGPTAYTQAFKITTFKIFHALYMIFYCANGDTITIDRNSVYITDATTQERSYTCVSNVECASFLAAGVDVDEKEAEVELAMAVYRNQTGIYNATELNMTTPEGTRRRLERQLNYQGHVWLDGSGQGCKVTKRGIHKLLVGGTGTPEDPYQYTNAGGVECMLPTSDHMHEAGEPCGEDGAMTSASDGGLMGLARKRRARKARRLSEVDLSSFTVMGNLGMDLDTEVIICPGLEQEAIAELELEVQVMMQAMNFLDNTLSSPPNSEADMASFNEAFEAALAGRRKLATDGAYTLCSKSLWNVYEVVFAGETYTSMMRTAADYCSICEMADNAGPGPKGQFIQNMVENFPDESTHFQCTEWDAAIASGKRGRGARLGCLEDRLTSYVKSRVYQLLVSYIYDTQTDFGVGADQTVAEAVAVIMGMYDQCRNFCDKTTPPRGQQTRAINMALRKNKKK